MGTKRFLFALAASLLIHAALLWPFGGRVSPTPPAVRTKLAVRLPPVLEPAPLISEAELVGAQASAVPPAPSLRAEPVHGMRRPQPLAGRALTAALAALAREEFYPREAIAQGLEGRVVLLLTLNEMGQITRIEVASSSGHQILDEAARKAATRIGRLPSGRRQALLPVEFRLE